MSSHKVVLIPGDGIGPEITVAVTRILEAAGADIEWVHRKAGESALETEGEVLPQNTIDAIAEVGIALKGPCTTPVGKGFKSVNVQLRKAFDLYAAVRPVRNLEGVKTRYAGVDLIVIRENTESLYSGVESEITPGVVTSTKVATEKGCTRIAKWAFEYARRKGRKKVTAFHKANIMKLTDGMFLRCAEEAHKDFPDIEYDTAIIDAACMRMVQDPTQFDMLLLENLYGDVVSDLAAGLVGGLGVTPGANFGEDRAIFEAVHGSAPDIAGQNKANPLALLMSAVMMLRHLAETSGDNSLDDAAERIKQAYDDCLKNGEKTGDLGGSLGTNEFADAIIARL
ncbi:MAG: isocitrate/isopropylmalate dehydrogenase family protein [Gammaproteobacteria bacterium]|jgi:isocitrate dehydrogenase (NAD+)